MVRLEVLVAIDHVIKVVGLNVNWLILAVNDIDWNTSVFIYNLPIIGSPYFMMNFSR